MSLANINTNLAELIGTEGTLVENLETLAQEVSATYDAIAEKDGIIPQDKNTANIATAIGTI